MLNNKHISFFQVREIAVNVSGISSLHWQSTAILALQEVSITIKRVVRVTTKCCRLLHKI